MDPEPNDKKKKKVIKVKVNDKRRAAHGPAAADDVAPESSSPSAVVPDAPAEAEQPKGEYLEDLKRLQADFDNYRKRMMRDQASVGERAAARVIENLLPVLDNFERAIAHGEGGEGVQLVFKDLKAALEREGLEEVPGEGVEFDPNVHEAIESREVEGLEQPTVIEVYRRGYMHKGQLLRAAMVVVGRPAEEQAGAADDEGSEE
ncbi:MAG TPA: nucleotide exchange factor GrpE [Actinomycetota bacterium]|nr:nucleotide exchange factor GrpE [Actinomycetota bacterium]